MIKLKEDEHVIAELERSYLSYVPCLFFALSCISVAFFLLFWLMQFQAKGWTAFGALIMFGLFLIARCVWDRRKNIVIVTDQRVVDITKHGVFHTEISELTLDLIEDVTVRKKGLWSRFFHIGSLMVIGMHGKMRFELHRVRNPIEAQELIMDAREAFMDEKRYGKKFTDGTDAFHAVQKHVDALSYKQIIEVKKQVDARVSAYERLIAKRKQSHL